MHQEDAGKRRRSTVSVPGKDHLHVNVHRYDLVGTHKLKAYVVTMQSVSPGSLNTPNQDNCHFLVFELKKGTEGCSTNQMDTGT